MKVRVHALDSVLEDLDRVQQKVASRAHQLFRERGGEWGRALDDWLRAEREVVWQPPMELVQEDHKLRLEFATAGVEVQDLDVRVTPQDIVITAPARHRHDDGTTVHVCEFKDGNLFRRVHLPRAVDPAGVRADYKNGLLRVTLPVVDESPLRVDVASAADQPAPERVDVEC